VQPEVWSSFTHDPRDPQFAALRASDRDRSVVQQVLAEAYADGRLDRAEYDERSEQVDRVRVLGDLNPLLLDLVAPPEPTGRSLARASRREIEERAQRAWQAKRREAVFSFFGASLLTTAIWFATSWGGGTFNPYFFWPGFVIALSFINMVRTAASRNEIVDNEIRRLEKKRDKELRSRPDEASG
jgi:hypothetical protein